MTTVTHSQKRARDDSEDEFDDESFAQRIVRKRLWEPRDDERPAARRIADRGRRPRWVLPEEAEEEAEEAEEWTEWDQQGFFRSKEEKRGLLSGRLCFVHSYGYYGCGADACVITIEEALERVAAEPRGYVLRKPDGYWELETVMYYESD